MPSEASRLAVLAGGGPMPATVAAAARKAGRAVFVLAFPGETDPATVRGFEHAWVRLGAVGRAVRTLRRWAVEEVVMIGPIRRPSFWTLRPDARALRMIARLPAGGRGDDSLLRVVVRELEGEGFRVVGAEALLPDLLAAEGVPTRAAPDATAWADIRHGIAVARNLGALDIGQAVVVQQGIVLGVEAAEGTDRLLARCAELRKPGPGGVLVKLVKPGQEVLADRPTIGPATVARAAEAGLRGLAVEAGGALVVERAAVVAAADRLGLFVAGVTP